VDFRPLKNLYGCIVSPYLYISYISPDITSMSPLSTGIWTDHPNVGQRPLWCAMRRWGEAVPGLQQSDALVFEDRDEMGEREREPPNLCLIYWGKWWNMMEHYGKCWFTMRFRGTLNISGNCSFPLIASHFAHRKLMSLRLCHIRGRSGRSIHAAIRGVRKR
jgi:hypothetical protein